MPMGFDLRDTYIHTELERIERPGGFPRKPVTGCSIQSFMSLARPYGYVTAEILQHEDMILVWKEGIDTMAKFWQDEDKKVQADRSLDVPDMTEAESTTANAVGGRVLDAETTTTKNSKGAVNAYVPGLYASEMASAPFVSFEEQSRKRGLQTIDFESINNSSKDKERSLKLAYRHYVKEK